MNIFKLNQQKRVHPAELFQRQLGGRAFAALQCPCAARGLPTPAPTTNATSAMAMNKKEKAACHRRRNPFHY